MVEQHILQFNLKWQKRKKVSSGSNLISRMNYEIHLRCKNSRRMNLFRVSLSLSLSSSQKNNIYTRKCLFAACDFPPSYQLYQIAMMMMILSLSLFLLFFFFRLNVPRSLRELFSFSFSFFKKPEHEKQI